MSEQKPTFDPVGWRETRDNLALALDLLGDAKAASDSHEAAGYLNRFFDLTEDISTNPTRYATDGTSARWSGASHRIMVLWMARTYSTRLSHQTLRSCSNCIEYFPRTLMLYDNDAGDYYCPGCCSDHAWSHNYSARRCQWYEPEYEDEDEDEPRYLHSYSASPIDYFGERYFKLPQEPVPTRNKTRLFGLEIEFEVDHGGKYSLGEMVNEIMSKPPGLGIFKSDGSLDHGAEYCTLPLTRGAVSLLEQPLNRLVEMGARAWNRETCGLHVHVSAGSASWPTWGKVERFMWSEANQSFLTRVAGRHPNGFCIRSDGFQPSQLDIKRARNKHRQARDGYGNRYEALNFATGGKPTVEFRLFRGNVAYHGVARAVQFCDSLLEFAASQPNGSPMNHQDYIAWLAERAQAYPQLRRFLRGTDDGETLRTKTSAGGYTVVQTAA